MKWSVQIRVPVWQSTEIEVEAENPEKAEALAEKALAERGPGGFEWRDGVDLDLLAAEFSADISEEEDETP